MKTAPHLVQYQGSKRNLAPQILRYIPQTTKRIVEPFSGTAAITIACAARRIGKEYVINDLNTALIELLELVVSRPEYTSLEYEKIWREQLEEGSLNHYYKVRNSFNATNAPIQFLYLLARCVKGSVRYNSDGQFNQGPDKRRMGTRPETMRKNIYNISALLNNKAVFSSKDYKEILKETAQGDVVYMDPPYQGVCRNRDSRYFAGINHDEFVDELRNLSERHISFIVSYDCKLGEINYGKEIPADVGIHHVFLDAGRSTQATLLGKNDRTVESLYVSNDLFENVFVSEFKVEQNELFARVS